MPKCHRANHEIVNDGELIHAMPATRSCHTKSLDVIQAEDYVPRRLGQTPTEAAAALVARVRGLAEWTEERLDLLLTEAGVTMEEAKTLSGQELMPARTVDAVAKLRKERRNEFDAVTRDCANEAVRVCADALYSALAFAPSPPAAPVPNALKTNLVFNPSFEEDNGDGVPDGWYVGWLDLSDRVGRAEWYRDKTHWNSLVKTGQRSVLLLWVPEKGLEWRQSWRHAIRCSGGETYCGTAWAKARGAAGAAWFGLQAYDTNYQPLDLVRSEPVTDGDAWQSLSAVIHVPQEAAWLRVLLRSEAGDGAVWFDDVEVVRVED